MKKLLLSGISLLLFWNAQAAQGNFKSIWPSDYEMSNEDLEDEVTPLQSYPPKNTIESNQLGLEDLADEEMSESTADDKLKMEQSVNQLQTSVSPIKSDRSDRDLFSPEIISLNPTMEESAEQNSNMDIDHQDEEGRTFLMRAIGRWGYCDSEFIAEVIKMLVNAGADVALVDNNGKGAMNYILEHPLISQEAKEGMIKLSNLPESTAAELVLFPFLKKAQKL